MSLNGEKMTSLLSSLQRTRTCTLKPSSLSLKLGVDRGPNARDKTSRQENDMRWRSHGDGKENMIAVWGRKPHDVCDLAMEDESLRL